MIAAVIDFVKTVWFYARVDKLQLFAHRLLMDLVNKGYVILHNCEIIGKKSDLTASEKSVLTSELANSKSRLEISRIIGRYH